MLDTLSRICYNSGVIENKTPLNGLHPTQRLGHNERIGFTMTVAPSLPSVRIPVNELHIGLRVRCVTSDSFNTQQGSIVKIVHGYHPAFYVALDGYRADELLFFSANELEAMK